MNRQQRRAYQKSLPAYQKMSKEAEAQMTYLNYNYKSNLKVSPAFLLDTKGCKNFLDKLLKGDGEETEDQKDGGQ